MHTTESIRNLLAKNPAAVERAILVIYDRQTRDEKSAEHTRHFNKVGFSAAHGKQGTYLAKWIKARLAGAPIKGKPTPKKELGECLSGHFVEEGKKLAMHYAGQLADIANQKEKSQDKPVVSEKQTVPTGSNWVGN